MKKHIIISTFFVIAALLLAGFSLAAPQLKDTIIDFTPYREVFVGEGVIYQIKITNTGISEQRDDIKPDSEIIKSIGTYRIDPSDRITLEPNETQTIYFYLRVEKSIKSRVEIPVEIISEDSASTIKLVGRTIGPFQPETRTTLLSQSFRSVFSAMIIIILLLAIMMYIYKTRKKNREEPDDYNKGSEENIESYY